MPTNLFDWDELNLVREESRILIREARRRKPDRERIDRFCDYVDFVLCLIYAFGWRDAETVVGPVRMPDGIDDTTVNLMIDGETFRDRLREQIDQLSEDGVERIINTEMHRDYNTGVVNAGQLSGKNVRKRWNTMMDEKVRDTHDYLEGAVVGINDLFYTFDGDSAMAPGGFDLAQNNVNCRCWITLEQ